MKASEDELSNFLSQHPSWTLSEDKLFKVFSLPSFTQAFAFMCEIAFLAEKQNHHPEWLNVYGKVEISLTTHEFEGVSDRDFILAKSIDKVAARRQKS